jgi:hypothetical protein
MKNESRTGRKFERIVRYFEKRKSDKFPRQDNPESIQTGMNSRREMIKNLAVLPVLGVPLFNIVKKTGWTSYAENNLEKGPILTAPGSAVPANFDISSLEAQVPKGKIKHLEISRLIPGGNLVSGFVYSRDLLYVSALMKKYFTDEKVIEILGLCEACGINTAFMRCDEHIIRIMKEYWKRGGKIQWVAQSYPKNDDMSNIKLAIDNGAVGAYVQGGIADNHVKGNSLEYLNKAIEFIRSQGLIAGTAAHMIQVPKTCIENGIIPDFFMKTFHHHNYWSAPGPERRDDGYSWCEAPEEVAAFFKTCKVPWIAYKVLAAGAIKPLDGFKYAYGSGADFTCVGMFDFQVIDNANATVTALKSDLGRERQWYA